jgi:intracellular sulfur oxidation DsrE/DsrF family protein
LQITLKYLLGKESDHKGNRNGGCWMGFRPREKWEAAMRIVIVLFMTALILGSSFQTDALAWEYPVITGYGPAQPLPDAAVQPDKSIKYKVLFDVIVASKKPPAVNPGLEHVARFINVMATAGMMPKSMELVAVIHGDATPLVLDNKIYKQKFGTNNPNLKLISDLKNAGVKLYVCGQALGDFRYKHDWVNPDIVIALSALSTVTTYELKGYAYVPFI